MSFFSYFHFFFLISYCFLPAYLLSQYPIILIVSYDAFRYDYLSKECITGHYLITGFHRLDDNESESDDKVMKFALSLPFIYISGFCFVCFFEPKQRRINWRVSPVASKLREEGTYAEYMNNVFVTKTFPNHHSIATGVYPEFHGVLGNTVYDSFYKRQLNYSYEFWHYSNEILPIWIANQKKGEGRHSGIMMWPGNEYEYSGIKPTHQKAWSHNVTWQQRVDGVIKWILNPEKPANLVLMYIEEPDMEGHSYGADSPQLVEELKLMDNLTGYLLDKLRENNLTDHVNLFLLADHGMLSVTKKDVIDLRKVVSSDLYDKYEGSPGIHIYPKPGKANEVYTALKKAVSDGAPFNVYKTADIPDRWHFKNNRRAPPIFAVADPPHVFHDFYPYIEDIQRRLNFTADDNTPFGIHGYDNEVQSMKPYFIAIGPNIKQGFKSEPFETVDLFSLWAHMSGFPEYALKTNGSLDIVSKMLRNHSNEEYNYINFGGVIVGVLLLSIVTIAMVYVFRKKYNTRKKSFSLRFGAESAESCQRLLDGEEDT